STMQATTPELVLEPGVPEFLSRHHAEGPFQTACEQVRACFPELRAFRVCLLDDPDEEGHTWVVLNPWLPAGHPPELLLDQRQRFHEELVQRLSPACRTLFGLSIDFTKE